MPGGSDQTRDTDINTAGFSNADDHLRGDVKLGQASRFFRAAGRGAANHGGGLCRGQAPDMDLIDIQHGDIAVAIHRVVPGQLRFVRDRDMDFCVGINHRACRRLALC